MLENLQWADSASLEMLHFVARQIGGDRVSDRRDAQRSRSSRERRAARRRSSRCATWRTRNAFASGRLPVDAVDRAARADVRRRRTARTRTSPNDCIAGRAAIRSSSTRRSRRSSKAGQLREAHGGWTGWDVDELRVPATIREAVLARLAELSPDARRLADIAAVLGTRATHDELAAASGTRRTTRSSRRSTSCAAPTCSTEREDGDDIVYDFSHPLLQETLYAELGLARTRTLHGAIAEALEALYGPRAMAHAGELAFHYARGDTRRLAAKAVQYLRAAGRDASAKYANREAADYLDRGARASRNRRARDQHASSSPSSRACASDSATTPARSRSGSARSTARRERERSRRASRRSSEASVWRATGAARSTSALAHYDAAIDAAHARAAIVHSRRACSFAQGELSAGDRSNPRNRGAEIERALAIATELGDDALLARVHRALLLLYLWTGPAEKALAHGERAIALAEASGQRSVAWSAHWALAMLGGLTGNSEAVRRHLARSAANRRRAAFAAVARCGPPKSRSSTRPGSANGITPSRSPSARSRWRARSGSERCCRDCSSGSGCCISAAATSSAARRASTKRGSFPAASDANEPCARRVHDRSGAHRSRGVPPRDRTSIREAIRVGEQGLRIADRSGYVVWAIHRLMPVIAEAALWASDMERASAIATRMRRESTALGQRLGLAWADACDALVEMLHGDPARAVSLLRGAAEPRSRRFRSSPTRRACDDSSRARSPRRAIVRVRRASCGARTKCSRTSARSASWTRRASSFASSARGRRRDR